MADYVRPPYLEELLPTKRVPDYVPDASPAAVAAPVTTADGAAAAEPAAVVAADPPAQPQTIKLTGRISSAVHVVERRGSTAVSFSLVESDANGPGVTHRVYATKQFAERLAKQQLTQGAVVEVAGQPQLREERQPDGTAKSVTYLYCFGVRVLATTH